MRLFERSKKVRIVFIGKGIFSSKIEQHFSEKEINTHLSFLIGLLSNPSTLTLKNYLVSISSLPRSNESLNHSLILPEVSNSDSKSHSRPQLKNKTELIVENQPKSTDVIITASFYQSALSCPHDFCSKEFFYCQKVAQDIIVTNRTLLSEFQSQILCYGNLIYEDAKKNLLDTNSNTIPMSLPEYGPGLNNKMAFRKIPSFFFIKNTFYIDYDPMDPCITDPLPSIISWLRLRQHLPDSKFFTTSSIENFKVQQIALLTFDDIPFEMDKFYLYFHKGHCEHIFVFNQLR